MNAPPSMAFDLVLIGGGHAHVHVLKMWAMRKLQKSKNHSRVRVAKSTSTDDAEEEDTIDMDNIQLTLISPQYHTPYSGMLPGYLAGHYTKDEMHLDLAKLARLSGARFLPTAACGLTYETSGSGSGGWITTTDGRPPIRYDCLSIDIGSAPSTWNETEDVDSYGVDAETKESDTTSTTHDTTKSTVVSPQSSTSEPITQASQLEATIPTDAKLVPETTAASTPRTSAKPLIVPVKPIASFCQQYDAAIQDYLLFANSSSNRKNSATTETSSSLPETPVQSHDAPTEPYTFAIVGGGAGGVELALSLDYQLSKTKTVPTSGNGTASGEGITQSSDAEPLTDRHWPYQIVLVTRSSSIMETHNRKVQKVFERILRERNIRVVHNANVKRVEEQQSTSSTSVDSTSHVPLKHVVYSASAAVSLEEKAKQPDNELEHTLAVHTCFWCVTARAATWLRTGTPLTVTTPGNFIRIADTHECIHHPGVFAAGDCCHMDDHPRPKAGVFAVRAGPILYENLVRYCTSRGRAAATAAALQRYTPQRSFLGLVSTGNKYAVASKGQWLCLEGAWLWNVKDWIDRKWMAKYSTDLPDLSEMMAEIANRGSSAPARKRRPRNRGQASNKRIARESNAAQAAAGFSTFADPNMRCGGCGAKVGSTIVARVLAAVHERQGQRAKQLGYAPPERIDHDDAAVTMLPSPPNGDTTGHSARAVIQSIDYFRELVNDPFTFGKIVAIHALSDMHAMGASASTALTLAVAPFATNEAITESVLLHLLSGVSDVLQDEGIALVGGHTCEGHELACGLSVMGFTHDTQSLLRKRGGRIGDKIVLTKPLGTGALFAAEMRARAKGDHVREALQSMLQSSYQASLVARSFDGVHSCTDVTGFGLIGHLLEMLMANEVSNDANGETLLSIGAVLDIAQMRFYQGGCEASAMGIFSSLQPSNARNRRAVVNHSQAVASFPVEYPLLFDPQTAGGLMFFVDSARCDEFLSKLSTANVDAFVIGAVESYAAGVLHHEVVCGKEDQVCTIGSGTSATGQRIRIRCP